MNTNMSERVIKVLIIVLNLVTVALTHVITECEKHQNISLFAQISS